MTQKEPRHPFEAPLREALLAGRTVPAAAQIAGISERTAFRWLASHRIELAVTALQVSPALRFLRPQAGRRR